MVDYEKYEDKRSTVVKDDSLKRDIWKTMVSLAWRNFEHENRSRENDKQDYYRNMLFFLSLSSLGASILVAMSAKLPIYIFVLAPLSAAVFYYDKHRQVETPNKETYVEPGRFLNLLKKYNEDWEVHTMMSRLASNDTWADELGFGVRGIQSWEEHIEKLEKEGERLINKCTNDLTGRARQKEVGEIVSGIIYLEWTKSTKFGPLESNYLTGRDRNGEITVVLHSEEDIGRIRSGIYDVEGVVRRKSKAEYPDNIETDRFIDTKPSKVERVEMNKEAI